MEVYTKDGNVLQYNGKCITPKATGEVWVLNDKIPVPESLLIGEVHYIVYDAPEFSWGTTDTATSIQMEEDGSAFQLLYGIQSVAGTSNDTWYIDEMHTTLTFTSTPTGDLLAWLQLNGTKQ